MEYLVGGRRLYSYLLPSSASSKSASVNGYVTRGFYLLSLSLSDYLSTYLTYLTSLNHTCKHATIHPSETFTFYLSLSRHFRLGRSDRVVHHHHHHHHLLNSIQFPFFSYHQNSNHQSSIPSPLTPSIPMAKFFFLFFSSTSPFLACLSRCEGHANIYGIAVLPHWDQSWWWWWWWNGTWEREKRKQKTGRNEEKEPPKNCSVDSITEYRDIYSGKIEDSHHTYTTPAALMCQSIGMIDLGVGVLSASDSGSGNSGFLF